MFTVSFGKSTYQRVAFFVTGLRNQNTVTTSTGLDKVVYADICHNLRSWVDLGVKLLLELPDSLPRGASALPDNLARRSQPEGVPFHPDSAPS